MSEESKTPPRIALHYVKSRDFRDVHVDGIIGGLTPKGLVHFACYVERLAIPQAVVHDITANGQLGDQVEEVTRGGVVRELQADLFMELQTARALREWLGKILKISEEALLFKEDTDKERGEPGA